MTNAAAAPSRTTRTFVVCLAVVLALAALLASLAPDIGPWGDGLGILAALADTTGTNLRVYHLGYGALARVAVSLGDGLGLSHEAALIHLSRAAIALGAMTTVAVALWRGARQLAAVGWVAVALASPSLLFFSGTVEVHGVQFMGSALALALVTLAARRTELTLRYGLVALAGALALALHLSHLLLVPALLASVLPADASGQLVRGGAARREWIGLAVLALLGIAAALLSYAVYQQHGDLLPRGLAKGPYFLGLYEHLFVEFRNNYGWFGPSGVWSYFKDQGLAQGGAMWVAAPLALVHARGRSRAAVVALLVVYLAVVPQSGIRERGAYFVSLFPWFAVFAAVGARSKMLALVPWMLLAPQLVLAWTDLSLYARRPDARTWSRAVVASVATPCTVFTSDMVRLSALPLSREGLDGLQWNQQFEFTPQRNWDAKLRAGYEGALVEALRHGRVYLDSEILPDIAQPATEQQLWAARLLDRTDVICVPVLDAAAQRTHLIEVSLR